MDKLPWQQDLDFQHESREATEEFQERYVLEHVNYCLKKSPMYKNRLSGTFKELTSLKDISKLGFTTKEDLLKFNNDFLAVPKADIVDTCFTSATEGTVPVNFLMTKSDLDRLAYNEKAAFQIAGITREDTVAVCVAIERGFMAGLAYFLGGVQLGAHMIRVGASGPQHIWNLIKTHSPTVLIGVPSVLANVALCAIQEGEDPTSLNLKKILAIGEPIRDRDLNSLPSVRRIEKLWGTKLYSTYASTEMATSFCECNERRGGHFRPELIYAELIDDEGNPVPDGAVGEVVITPLGVQGMPLMRFKTGDMSYIVHENCACGRTTKRIGPVLGRKSQLLKYRGTNVFPNAIVSIVEANPDFSGCFVEAYTAEFGEDRVVAVISAANKNYDLSKLKEQFRAGLRVVPELRMIGETELLEKVMPEGKRKRKLFFDLRKDV